MSIELKRQEIQPLGRLGMTHTKDGRLCLFVRSKTGELLWNEEIEEGQMGEWNVIEEYGEKQVDIERGIYAALYKRDGRIGVFAIGIHGESLNGWLEEGERRKKICWNESGELVGETMEVCARCNGGIELFRLDFAGRLWHQWTDKKGNWSQWQALEGQYGTAITVTHNKEGFPEIFLINEEKSILTRRHHDDGLWGEWQVLKQYKAEKMKSIQEKDGTIRIFLIETDGKLLTCKQGKEMDTWEGWEILQVEACRDIAPVMDKNGNVRVISVCYDGNIIEYVRKGRWETDRKHFIKAEKIESANDSLGGEFYAVIGKDRYLYITK